MTVTYRDSYYSVNSLADFQGSASARSFPTPHDKLLGWAPEIIAERNRKPVAARDRRAAVRQASRALAATKGAATTTTTWAEDGAPVGPTRAPNPGQDRQGAARCRLSFPGGDISLVSRIAGEVQFRLNHYLVKLRRPYPLEPPTS